MPDFGKVLLIGPGLLGGSIGLALKRKDPTTHITIWGRRQEALDLALNRGAADSAETDLAKSCQQTDLAVLCTPTRTFENLAPILQQHLPEDSIVTDVGSVKTPVLQIMEKYFPERFVGAHPMAGSEKSGIEHADANLFREATCILTPTTRTSQAALDAADVFWNTLLECRILQMPAAEHDQAAAMLSHLPHLLAAVLSATCAHSSPTHHAIAGPGFRDTTRVSDGPPEMWSAILSDNRAALAPALALFIAELEKFSSALRSDSAETAAQLLASARAARRTILNAAENS